MPAIEYDNGFVKVMLFANGMIHMTHGGLNRMMAEKIPEPKDLNVPAVVNKVQGMLRDAEQLYFDSKNTINWPAYGERVKALKEVLEMLEGKDR
jgi:hypothetical protein